MRRKTWKNKEGSALLIAIVIMMVVTMLSLALLLVSFSLFSTANKQKNVEQCKEIAQGISREIEQELTTVQCDTSAQLVEILGSDEYPLWSYLRFNMWQSSWPYYNIEELGHDGKYAIREFQLTSSGSDTDILSNVTVEMYWESEAGAVRVTPEGESEDTTFNIEVTCQQGNQKSTITTPYQLSVEIDADFGGSGDNYIASAYNPDRNTIQDNEKWTFSASDHE